MELNHDIGIEEIYLPSDNRKDTYSCEDFIIYPEGKEKHGGYLLGIIELRATPIAESEKVLQILINTLKDNYYEQIGASPEPERLNLETVFEYALQKTNNAITELIQLGHLNIAMENLHYLVAVAKPNICTREINFVFAQQGLVQAYLLHKTKQNNYKIINILDNAPRLHEERVDKLKIFSSTLSGVINFHDALYFCSEIFSNYIPAHKVNKILSANDLPAAIDYFKTLVNNVRGNSHLTYCAIFIKLEEKRVANEQPVSQKSIDQLIATQENTGKFLAPNFALNIRNTLLKISQIFRPTPGKLYGPKSSGQQIFLILLLRRIGALSLAAITAIGTTLSNRITRLSGRRPPATNAGQQPVLTKKKINFRRISKPALSIAILLVLIFVSSIFWIRHREAIKIEQAAYTIQINSAKDLINNAQASLIYKDETQSLTLAKQADEIIKYLPQATKDQKANFAELSEQVSGIMNKLRHVDKIIPQALATISNGDKPIMLDQVQKSGDHLFVNARDNALFEINTKNHEINEPVLSAGGDLYQSASYEGKLFYLTNQNKLQSYNAANRAFTDFSIDWGNAPNLTATEIYNDALYALDTASQKIYRWKSAETDFGVRSEWLKDKADADLSQATDFCIDGNMYVITTDGNVYKFFTGKKQAFSLAPVEPALHQAKKIYTTAELPQLFILEESGKRLVVYNKDGSFVSQYLFETLDNPIADFIIEGRTIYFVSGDKVYAANY